jgi:hypothetical protein
VKGATTMQEIKGEKFYVSLGYVDEEKLQASINVRDIKNIILQIKDGTVYLDDRDKENPIRIPLMRIKEIQKQDDIFKFRYLFDSYKAFWTNDDKTKEPLKINIIGLFGQIEEDADTIIRHIGFFTTETEYFNEDRTITISLEVEESKILGE